MPASSLPGIASAPLPGIGTGTGSKGGILVTRPFVLAPGTTQFVAPYTGRFAFRCWGGGGGGVYGSGAVSCGAAGGYAIRTVYLVALQVVPVSIGLGGLGDGSAVGAQAGGTTTVTLPTFSFGATGGGAGAVNTVAQPGAGFGGDLNLTGGAGNGGAGQGSNAGTPGPNGGGSFTGLGPGGGSAPGDVTMTGGNGGGVGTQTPQGTVPGGGGGVSSGSRGVSGGSGLIVIDYEGP